MVSGIYKVGTHRLGTRNQQQPQTLSNPSHRGEHGQVEESSTLDGYLRS